MSHDHHLRSGQPAEAQIDQAVTRTLADPFLGHDTATVTLAAAFDNHRRGDRTLTAMRHELLGWFDESARPLFGIGHHGLHDQAAALTQTICDQLPAVADSRDHETLLLDRALMRGRGHPLLMAIIGHELARRAGLHSVVAHGQDRYWTILSRDGYCLPIGYTTPPTSGLCVEQLRCCCAHETAYRTLIALINHAPTPAADRAARICDALPLNDCAQDHTAGP